MPDRRPPVRALARAVIRTMFAYSTLVAVYLVANSIAHRETMTMPLTHYLDVPTEGTVLAAALACSISAYFLLRVQAQVARLRKGATHE